MQNQESKAVNHSDIRRNYPRLNPLAVVSLRRFKSEMIEQGLHVSLDDVMAAVKTLIEYDDSVKTNLALVLNQCQGARP